MEVALFVHFPSKKRKRKKKAIEKFIPHTSCQTSPMKIKVINIKLLNLKKKIEDLQKNVMVVCVFDLCSSI